MRLAYPCPVRSAVGSAEHSFADSQPVDCARVAVTYAASQQCADLVVADYSALPAAAEDTAVAPVVHADQGAG